MHEILWKANVTMIFDGDESDGHEKDHLMISVMMIDDDDYEQYTLYKISFLELLSSLFNVSKNSNLDMHGILWKVNGDDDDVYLC